MTWATGKTNPLVIYPAPNVYNPRFASALAGSSVNGWQGAGAVSIVTGEGSVGQNCIRVNPAAATATVLQDVVLSSRFKSYVNENAAGSFYIYFRAKSKSCTPNAYLDCRFGWLDNTATLIGAFVYSYIALGSSALTTGNYVLPTDNTWRYFRAFGTIPAMPSNAYYADILLGNSTGAYTHNSYIDDVSFGHVVDFQEIGTTPDGARAVHPYEIPKLVASVSTVAPNGNYASTLLAAGLSRGRIVTSPINDAGKAIVSSFNDYAADGTPFAIYLNQADATRDNYTKCALYGNGRFDDGFKQLAGRKDWIWTRDWRQVP